MASNVTIIVYHYVREIKKSRYPGIKGLETSDFKDQLGYIRRKYKIIRMDDLLESIHLNSQLPENAALLTFDDAYLDHYTQVFPILRKFDIQGSFYIPAKMIAERKVLNVNKIHFILALSSDKSHIIHRICKEVEKIREQISFPSAADLFKSYGTGYLNDCSQVMFIKRMLQKVLPQPHRSNLIDQLFQEAIQTDEESFSRELYVTKELLEHMLSSGMHLGNHTYSHPWLNTLPKEEQEVEIRLCNQFLQSLGVKKENWTMCFPHGGYNQETLNILNSMDCKLGLTVVPGVAEINSLQYLEVPRLDTNDLKHNCPRA